MGTNDKIWTFNAPFNDRFWGGVVHADHTETWSAPSKLYFDLQNLRNTFSWKYAYKNIF